MQDPPDGQITIDDDLFDAVVDFKGRITEQASEYVDRHFPNARELMRDLPPESYRAGDARFNSRNEVATAIHLNHSTNPALGNGL